MGGQEKNFVGEGGRETSEDTDEEPRPAEYLNKVVERNGIRVYDFGLDLRLERRLEQAGEEYELPLDCVWRVYFTRPFSGLSKQVKDLIKKSLSATHFRKPNVHHCYPPDATQSFEAVEELTTHSGEPPIMRMEPVSVLDAVEYHAYVDDVLHDIPTRWQNGDITTEQARMEVMQVEVLHSVTTLDEYEQHLLHHFLPWMRGELEEGRLEEGVARGCVEQLDEFAQRLLGAREVFGSGHGLLAMRWNEDIELNRNKKGQERFAQHNLPGSEAATIPREIRDKFA